MFGDDDACRTKKSVAKFVALSKLLHNLAFRNFRSFLLRYGLVHVRIERLVCRIQFLQARLRQCRLKLLIYHVHPGLQRLHSVTLAARLRGLHAEVTAS